MKLRLMNNKIVNIRFWSFTKCVLLIWFALSMLFYLGMFLVLTGAYLAARFIP